jgi:hypothetical protein
MNTFIETDYSEYNDYNMALVSDNKVPEQQMAPMDDSENFEHSSTAGNKGDSALTAFLRSKKQDTLSGTQHTNSTFDTFSGVQEWQYDDDGLDNESVFSLDINDIENDLIPLSSYNEDAVDEALKWTGAFMDQDDEESIEEAPLHDSMSSLNNAFENLTKSMERSAFTRQLVMQYSEKSLGSSTSTTEDHISQHSFNAEHHDSPQELQDPLGPSSCHSTSSGLVRPRIKKAQATIARRSGLIRRHSHRTISGQDIAKSGLGVKKDSLSSLNGSLKSISLHGNVRWRNLSRGSSFRKSKLSQETSCSGLVDSSSSLNLPVKAAPAGLSQNVKRRLLVQDFVFSAPKLKPGMNLQPKCNALKPTSNDTVQRFSQSMSSIGV